MTRNRLILVFSNLNICNSSISDKTLHVYNNRDSYRGGTWEIPPPNLSSPPKILTCCHDLVMHNIILLELNCLVFSSIHLMKNECISTTHKSF